VALLAPAEKEKTPPVEADLDMGGAAPPPPPNTVSFLAAEPPEKLKAAGAGPGSVLDFPNEKRLAGFSMA